MERIQWQVNCQSCGETIVKGEQGVTVGEQKVNIGDQSAAVAAHAQRKAGRHHVNFAVKFPSGYASYTFKVTGNITAGSPP